MPAALDVDREAVRTLSVAVGPREAARQMGLPEATVLAWSKRFNWTSAITNAKAIQIERKDVQSVAIKPADALANRLAADESSVKTSLSATFRRTAGHMSKMLPEHVYATADKAKAIVSSAAQLYQWDAKQGQQTNVAVNIALLGS